MDPRTTPGPAALLGEADFVRALARSLLADAAAADDVAQEVLVAGLGRGPEQAGALRAWLASAVRKLVHLRRRGEARRAAREERAARLERLPSTAEVVEREALRAAVVRAVLALDEPYRTVILLRFYEGVPPRAIAARLGVPVETVQTRTKRALARLRARLDREHGPRAAWAALLLPLAHSGPALRGPAHSPSSRPSWMPMLAPKLLLFSLPLVFLGLRWLPARGAGPAVTEPALAEPARAARAAAPEPTSAIGHREPAAVATPRAQGNGDATLSLTITWHDGTPAAGIQVRVSDAGRPTYAALEGRTDAAGAVRFTALRAGKASVHVDRKPRADVATLSAGQETRLALQIPRGFDLEGLVRDAAGAPVAGATIWMGRSDPPYFPVATSAADGSFRVRSLQARVGLCARKDGHAPSLARSFRHPDGSVVQETFELRGPGAAVSGVVRDAAGEPLADALVLLDGQGMLREEDPLLPPGVTAGIAYAIDSVRGAHAGPQTVRTDGAGRFALGGLRPGRVPLGVIARGHAPWRGALEVAAGASGTTEIRLARGWSLAGQLLDADGNPAAGRLIVHSAPVPGLLCPMLEVGPDGAFALVDLPPGQLSVWIGSAESAASTTLRGAAGDVLTWEAVLGTASGDGAEIDLWDG